MQPRVALVTGGAGGIGRAIVAALAADGNRVASGDIVYNYVSVTGRGDLGEGIGVTAGVKNAGTGAGVGSTYVEFISTAGDPRVQSGKAVRLTAS